ncbi:MAG: sulfate adenylyltransferase subunit CysN [Reyranella sp.]|nr:sulfate adenylyltransferase subunit CysN [Reyranella sp.]
MSSPLASPASSAVPLASRSELRLLTCGSVDDGKSTLIGRLINDAAGLFEDQIKSLRDDSRRFGTTDDDIDFALLLDGLEAEREQGITIDVAYRFFATTKRAFVVADTPGHQQYTRNMATGASNAELAILLIDARKGMLEQTRRHAAIVSLLGIRHVVLAVNKIDLVDFDRARFREIEADFAAFAAPLAFSSIIAIPLSARFGDNVATRSDRMAWYDGPSLLHHLETIETDHAGMAASLRFPVQWVNRPDAEFRGFAGTIASGRVAVGDSVVVANSGQTTQVTRIVTFDGDLATAESGRSVTLTLADEIDIARGDVLGHPKDRPTVTRRVGADLIWMDDTPAGIGQHFLLKIGTATVPAKLSHVADTLVVETLDRQPSTSLALNAIGRVHIETGRPIAFDPYTVNRQTGGFILIDRTTFRTMAAGMVVESLDRATNVHHQPEVVTTPVREAVKGQKSLVVWFTGLPSSGKSTIANLVEAKLVALGRHTMLLDGDNLRQGLNADLGFDAAARSENVRRVGEVAKLMADAGLITIVALVSPFRADRERAATLMSDGRFLEIFVDTPTEVCRARDTKGLYAKASAGKISNMTGRDQVYEVPMQPALVLPTTELSPSEAADHVVKLVLERIQDRPSQVL